MSAISLMSAPAAKTRSPPYTTTALMSSRSVASAATARISSWTCTLSAFILGRSRRIVPTPSATSSLTNSINAPWVSTSSTTEPAPALCRALDPSGTMPPVTAGLWRNLGERASVWPGRSFPLGSTWSSGVDELRGLRPQRHRRLGLPLRRRGRGDPAPADRAHAGHLARRDPRRRAGHLLRLPGRRRLGARGRPALQRGEAAAGPVRASGQRIDRLRPGDLRLRPRGAGRAQPAGLRGVRPAQRGGRRRRLRLGRRPAAAAQMARHRHLRAARQGHDRAARPGAGAPARHLRRARLPRRRRLPEGPRRHRGGAAADPPVRLRARGGEPRADQLLGLQLDRVLRPAQRVLVLRRPRAAGHGVQGDGEGAARRRDRGAARCRLQPHRRGLAGRPDAVLPRPGRPGQLPPRAVSRAPASRSTTPTGT